MSGEVRVVISVDVEEEGLFSGRYAPRAEGVRNVAGLERLAFVAEEFGLPLTLLCTWPVLTDAGCAGLLRRWREERGAEIGLHLHHWNTPPFARGGIAAGSLPPELLDAKLATLAEAAQRVAGKPAVSFRMGRFDLAQPVRALLPSHGVRADSSLVPLRFVSGMPDDFLASADPHPLGGTRGKVTEVPLTVAALAPLTARFAHGAARLLPGKSGQALLSGFRKFAAVGVQPAWYGLPAMRLAARLHMARGGRVIHLFLHSSELTPGHAPHVPDVAAANRLTARIREFLGWLSRRTALRGATMADIASDMRPPQRSEP